MMPYPPGHLSAHLRAVTPPRPHPYLTRGLGRAYVEGMKFARVDVHYPLNGGTMVCSFSLEHAARAFVREQKLATYKITINGYVLAREGC